jgi:transcriptional regulator with XRE-family HTH domain
VDNVDKIKIIKETLEKRGVSQTKLADLMGVNLTTVNNWFRRESIPQKYIDNISKLFNLNIGDPTGSYSLKKDTPQLDISNQEGIKPLKEGINEYFTIDKTLIDPQKLHNFRYNYSVDSQNCVDIIDISVDKYCGDGLYYINYPHAVLVKRIVFNFDNNSYTVSDLTSKNNDLVVVNLSGKIFGKVKIRMELF